MAYVHFCVQHHFEEVKVMFLIRSQDTFSVRGQIVTILVFVGHTVFVETATEVQKQPQTICKKMIDPAGTGVGWRRHAGPCGPRWHLRPGGTQLMCAAVLCEACTRWHGQSPNTHPCRSSINANSVFCFFLLLPSLKLKIDVLKRDQQTGRRAGLRRRPELPFGD